MLKDATVGKPFFLSGGIEPGDEEQLKEFATLPVGKALFSVDINSKFEVSPGIKDMAKVKEFVSRLNSRY
jgi:phosphoribosylanthranilate isomerase